MTGIRAVRIEDRKPPLCTPNEALVRIKAVGICRSDVHYFLRGSIGETRARFPFVVGHECSGVVEEAGGVLTGICPGDRVVLEPARSCGACEFCRKGRPNICPNVLFLGTPPTEGALQELVPFPPSSLLPLPPALRFEEGVMAEPLAIAIHILNLASPHPGAIAAVVGTGPIGLTTLKVAQLKGVETLIAVDPLEHRREWALRWGASVVVDPQKEDPVQAIMDLTKNRGVDLVFEAAGTRDAVAQSVAMAAPGGKVLLTGIPETQEVSFNSHVFRRREITIQAVRRSNRCTEEALHLIAGGKVPCGELVTHSFPLDKTEEALWLAAEYRDGVVKTMICLEG